jgi:hypothetical protein
MMSNEKSPGIFGIMIKVFYNLACLYWDQDKTTKNFIAFKATCSSDPNNGGGGLCSRKCYRR